MSPSLGPRGRLFCWDLKDKWELAGQRGREENILERRNGLCKGPEAIKSIWHIQENQGSPAWSGNGQAVVGGAKSGVWILFQGLWEALLQGL